MKTRVNYSKRFTLLIILLLVGLSFKSYSQQYLPLTGGTLTGNVSIVGNLQLQIPYLGFNNGAIAQPVASNNVAIYPNSSVGTLDMIGYGNGWRFVPLNQSSYSAAVVTIDASGNTNISGNTYVAQNLGVGTTTPNGKLDVNGVFTMQSFAYLSSQRTNNNSYTNLFLGGGLKDNNDGTFTAIGDGGSNYFGAIRMDNSGGNLGAINFYTCKSVSGSSYSITNATLSNDLAMSIVGGNVAIGTSNPNGYKLAVNGSAIATSFTVKAYANWPDYVFKSDYKLPSLNAVKAYIDQNHHLPDVPSAEQVAKDGLNLGDMNKLLMQKTEELTLYLIEKDKQVKSQQQEIDNQKLIVGQQAEELKSLQGQMTQLKTQLSSLLKQQKN